MALKIRLTQQGKKGERSYRIVVADEKTRRDGRYQDNIGLYNPHAPKDKVAQINLDSLKEWFSKGAQMTDSVSDLLGHHSEEFRIWYKEELQKKRAKKIKERAARRARAKAPVAAKKVAETAQESAPAVKKAPAAKKAAAPKKAAEKKKEE